jgi:hypothetical protein
VELLEPAVLVALELQIRWHQPVYLLLVPAVVVGAMALVFRAEQVGQAGSLLVAAAVVAHRNLEQHQGQAGMAQMEL